MKIFEAAVAGIILGCLVVSTHVAAQVVTPGAGCTTCQPNEAAVISVDTVGHGKYTYTGSPTCQAGSSDDLKTALNGIEKAFLEDYAGALTDLVKTDEFRKASEPVHGDVGKVLNGGRTDTASCQMICNLVPLKAKITDYSIYAGESADKLQKCVPGKDCPIGWSKFSDIPATTASDGSQAQCVTFMNWSADRDRVARLVTFFEPPANWQKGRSF